MYSVRLVITVQQGLLPVLHVLLELLLTKKARQYAKHVKQAVTLKHMLPSVPCVNQAVHRTRVELAAVSCALLALTHPTMLQ